MVERTLEQRLLETTDRNEGDRRLGRESRQIGDALGNAMEDAHVTGHGTTGDKIAFATRREQRHDLWIADVDAEMVEICEVTLARDQQLRTEPRIQLGWWAAVYDENRQLETSELDRQCQTHRARANDRYIEVLRRKRELRHGPAPSASAVVRG